MTENLLPEEELTRLTRIMLELSADERDFLLDLFRMRAQDFYQKLNDSLPAVDDFFDWDHRLLQQLIRDLSFKEIAWAFLGDKPEIFELFGENISARGRRILKEEIQRVKKERKRRLENNRVTPEQIERFKRRKRLLLKLRAQELLSRREEISED